MPVARPLDHAREQEQQRRWNSMTVQSIRELRKAMLNNTLEHTCRHRYLALRPANDQHAATGDRSVTTQAGLHALAVNGSGHPRSPSGQRPYG